MVLERKQVIVVGSGLAGSEAAWQPAERGIPVALYEMRPARTTPAHKTDRLAELVCSNSLKSNAPGSASWLLKEKLRRAGSLLLSIADANAVPGGGPPADLAAWFDQVAKETFVFPTPQSPPRLGMGTRGGATDHGPAAGGITDFLHG